MSDSVRDLLTRGVAAAKAKELKEARFFLEWVLRREDADRDQKANAWLWLSEASNDPVEKRKCLENVLVNDPQHPLARRGLAILNGLLKPEDIVEQHELIRPLQPAKSPPSTSVRRYVCPKCGGVMAYDANRRALSCGYCGHRMWEYDAVMSGGLESVDEQNFAAALPTAKAHRWELASERVLMCQGCGATFILPPAHVSGGCPFCQSPHIVESDQERELIQPEGVLPFQFDAAAATRHMHRWLKKQRLRPGDLEKKAATVSPRGIYVPFWTFDISGEVKWHGMVREGYGDHARWVPRDGSQLVYYNDLLVPASHSLPGDLLVKLTGFETTQSLAPYSPDALASWPAEVYQIPMADASLVARQRALEQARSKARAHLTSQVRDFSFGSGGIAVDSYKLVLLPVWVTGYRYKRQFCPVLINGQTGEGTGRVPRSGWQKMIVSLWGSLFY